MFYLKILGLQLNWHWTLVSQTENMYLGSVDRENEIKGFIGNSYGIIGYKREIRHGQFIRTWERSV